jgi:hypothetical protein
VRDTRTHVKIGPMSTPPASPSLTFRARRFPVWLCFSIAAFLLLLTVVMVFAAFGTARDGVGLALLFVVILGLPGAFIFKLGNDVRRSRIVLTADGVDLRVGRFSIWALRRLGSARLAWRDVHGVQRYEIPNFAATGGVQVDYVLHTAQGAFAVSTVQFAEAERVATLIAERIGRAIDDLPPGIAPVTARNAAGRRGVRLMRALGWIAQAAGLACAALLLAAWLSGSPLASGTIGGVAATSGVLLMLGRALRHFSLK